MLTLLRYIDLLIIPANFIIIIIAILFNNAIFIKETKYMNKHYIRVDEKGRIIAGLTDDNIAYPDGVQESDIFTHEGGRLFELLADGEWLTNPPLTDTDGVCLYKRVGDLNVSRTPEEIEADRPPEPELPDPPPDDLLGRVENLENVAVELKTVVDDLVETVNDLLEASRN